MSLISFEHRADRKGRTVGRGGVAWGPGDLTGGPIDEVFDALRARFADLWIERLRVTHPADDNNLWYLGLRGRDEDVQIECAPDGRSPFTLESDTAREEALDVGNAVATLSEWLEGR
jgi:hypothetical protein